MDRLRPPRPALKLGEKGLVLIHTPPTYASHVALYLHDADGKKRFLDADKNKFLAPGETGSALGIETSLRCPISTGLLVNPLKARPCGHVYSKASAMSYFKGVGKRCAVFGCDKHLKWSDFVVDEASEHALREYYRRQARTRQDSDGHPYGQLM